MRELYSHKWEYGEGKQVVRCLGGKYFHFLVEMLDTAEPLLGAEDQPGCLLPSTGVGQGSGCCRIQEWGRMSASVVIAAPGIIPIISFLPSSPPKGSSQLLHFTMSPKPFKRPHHSTCSSLQL